MGLTDTPGKLEAAEVTHRDAAEQALMREFPGLCCPKCGRKDTLRIRSCEWNVSRTLMYEVPSDYDHVERFTKFEASCLCGTLVNVEIVREGFGT